MADTAPDLPGEPRAVDAVDVGAVVFETGARALRTQPATGSSCTPGGTRRTACRPDRPRAFVVAAPGWQACPRSRRATCWCSPTCPRTGWYGDPGRRYAVRLDREPVRTLTAGHPAPARPRGALEPGGRTARISAGSSRRLRRAGGPGGRAGQRRARRPRRLGRRRGPGAAAGPHRSRRRGVPAAAGPHRDRLRRSARLPGGARRQLRRAPCHHADRPGSSDRAARARRRSAGLATAAGPAGERPAGGPRGGRAGDRRSSPGCGSATGSAVGGRSAGSWMRAWYRLGGGARGNVAADRLVRCSPAPTAARPWPPVHGRVLEPAARVRRRRPAGARRGAAARAAGVPAPAARSHLGRLRRQPPTGTPACSALSPAAGGPAPGTPRR